MAKRQGSGGMIFAASVLTVVALGTFAYKMAPSFQQGFNHFFGLSSGVTSHNLAITNSANTNPSVDSGSGLSRTKAPNFTLTDQFGARVSLTDFRGKVIIMAFVDSTCTNICPLTTASMLAAVRQLGVAASDVQLLGVNANPINTSVADVRAYSEAHGLMNHWLFLTGSKQQLSKVWQSYHMYSGIVNGQIDHTAGLFVIDQRGRERKLYLTQMSYAGTAAQGQILANEVATLLPKGSANLHKPVQLPPLTPTLPGQLVSVNGKSGGSTVQGQSAQVANKAHLLMFFGTWLTPTATVRASLLALNQYASDAKKHGWPQPMLVDEAATEGSPNALRTYVSTLPTLHYPAVIDVTGEAADAVTAQDLPWIALVNAQGKVLYTHDGFLPLKTLEQQIAKHVRS